MKDALPDLFEAAPDLMYSLVTMMSPENLQVCVHICNQHCIQPVIAQIASAFVVTDCM